MQVNFLNRCKANFFRYIIILIFCFLFIGSKSFGQWQNVFEPASFQVRSIAKNGSEILIGTKSQELFYSDDDGKTWKKIFLELPIGHRSIDNILITSSTFLVAIDGFGIRRSNDRGETWTWANTGLENFKLNSMLEWQGKVYVATATGIYFSEVEQDQWQHLNKELSQLSVTSLATHSRSIFAGTLQGELWQLHAGSQHWEKININGLRSAINSITFQNEDIFLGTSGQGIVKVNTESKTADWIKNGIPVSYINDLAANDQKLFAATPAGLYISNNKGQEWLLSDDKSVKSYESVSSVEVNNDKVIMGGDRQGINLSNDGGISWRKISSAVTNAPISNILPTFYGLFVATDESLYLTTDGQNYLFKSQHQIPVNQIVALKRYLFLATENGILRSADQGLSWKKMSADIAVKQLVVTGNVLIGATRYQQLIISRDAGGSWATIGKFSLGYEIKSVVGKDDWIFVGTSVGFFSLRLKDGVWKTAEKSFASSEVSHIAMIQNQLVAASAQNDAYKISVSKDHGRTWKELTEIALESPVTEMVVAEEKLIIKENSGRLSAFKLKENKVEAYYHWNEPVTNINSLAVYQGNLMAGTQNTGLWSYELQNLPFQKVLDSNPEFYVSIYPNPTQSDVSVLLKSGFNKPTTICIKNELGATLKSVVVEQNMLSTQIPFSDLPAGNYFLEINCEDKRKVRRIIKTEP